MLCVVRVTNKKCLIQVMPFTYFNFFTDYCLRNLKYAHVGIN